MWPPPPPWLTRTWPVRDESRRTGRCGGPQWAIGSSPQLSGPTAGGVWRPSRPNRCPPPRAKAESAANTDPHDTRTTPGRHPDDTSALPLSSTPPTTHAALLSPALLHPPRSHTYQQVSVVDALVDDDCFARRQWPGSTAPPVSPRASPPLQGAHLPHPSAPSLGAATSLPLHSVHSRSSQRTCVALPSLAASSSSPAESSASLRLHLSPPSPPRLPPLSAALTASAPRQHLPHVSYYPCSPLSLSSAATAHPRCPPLSPTSLATLPLRAVSDTTAAEFEAEFDQLVELIQLRLEQSDVEGHNLDVSYHSGVLSIKSDRAGVWVLNQYAVTRQVWLSSPISGPSKYNWHRQKERKGGQGRGVWCSERDDGKQLQPLLEAEFSEAFNTQLAFDEPF